MNKYNIEHKINDGMLESAELANQEPKETKECSYMIKGMKINYCMKALYGKYEKCGYLKNKKECERK